MDDYVALMRARESWRLRVLPVVIMLGVCGCDFSSLTALSNDFGGHLTRIGVSGDTIVAVGDTVRLRAAGSLDGLIGILSYDPMNDARWSSWPTSVAVVQSGAKGSTILLRGISPGLAIIEAKARGVTGTYVVFVHRQLPPPSMDRSARALEPVGHDPLLRSHEAELNVVP
jgi:hypothetical protein